MAKHFLYILLILASIIACEEIYVPELENVDDLLVVEAILIADQTQNDIHLYKTLNFNSESNTYPAVTKAKVKLIDDKGVSTILTEVNNGTYRFNGLLDKNRKYYLSIVSGNDAYISEVQTVPDIPDIDVVYAAYDTKTSTSGAVNSEEDVVTKPGFQVFADISDKEDLNHYRFYGRKIIEYYDFYDTVMYGEPMKMPIYGWRSYLPSGTFNIAAPPKYSAEKNIKKHRLEFFNQNYYEFVADTQYFAGWIYIIDQYGISEKAYNYYSDLNSQLEASGKIFDPVYVQAQGNISCTNDPEKLVLGNFEIESHKEHRYILKYNRNSEKFSLKKITQYYDIPGNGYIKDTPPVFWE